MRKMVSNVKVTATISFYDVHVNLMLVPADKKR